LTCLLLLEFSPAFFSKTWNWSSFYFLLKHPDQKVRFYAMEATSYLLGMGDHGKENLERELCSFDEEFLLSMRFDL